MLLMQWVRQMTSAFEIKQSKVTVNSQALLGCRPNELELERFITSWTGMELFTFAAPTGFESKGDNSCLERWPKPRNALVWSVNFTDQLTKIASSWGLHSNGEHIFADCMTKIPKLFRLRDSCQSESRTLAFIVRNAEGNWQCCLCLPTSTDNTERLLYRNASVPPPRGNPFIFYFFSSL